MKKYTAMYPKYTHTHSQSGLSLIELMISLTIGLVLLVGITTLIVQQSNSRNELDKSSRQIENGRYAMQILHDDIDHAGFYSTYSPPSGTIYTTPNPCLTVDNTANLATTGNQGWINNSITAPTVPVGIYGYSGASTDPTPTTCLQDYKPNTAVLVIRRTATPSINVASAVAATNYLQVSQCQSGTVPFVLGTGGYTLKQKDCTTVNSLRAYIVRIYYISTCSVCGTDTIPTLKVVEFMNGTQTTIPLVEGIENMQFDYGVDTTNDGSPDDYYQASGITAANWPNVMTIKVNLLARNNECTAGYTDSNTYTLGLAGTATALATCTNGGFKRHVYSELVRATNLSGRRE